MQYIASNITPTFCYHRVTPNSPSSEGGGGVSGMLLTNRTLLDNLLQQNDQCLEDQCGFGRLASRVTSIGSPTIALLLESCLVSELQYVAPCKGVRNMLR